MNDKPIVYIVDDERAVRELARHTIEAMRFDARCFDSGHDFLELYDDRRIACLLTDLHMPDLTGQQILEALAGRKAIMPVIMMSGNGNIRAAVKAMGFGAIEFLEKPCSLDALRSSVRAAIELAEKRHREASQSRTLVERLERLDPEERITMQMIAGGKPDKAIASKLDASLRTIQFRRASLMKKLGVKSRAELIRIAASLEPSRAVK